MAELTPENFGSPQAQKASEYVSPGDYLKLGMKGFANLATTAGEGVKLLGGQSGSTALRDIGQNAEDYWQNSMTPEGAEGLEAGLQK